MSRRSNSSQLIGYIFRYVFNHEKVNANAKAEKIPSSKFIIKHNVRSRSLNGFVMEFKENEAYRLVKRKDSTIIHHTVLSFSNKDTKHITDKLLKDIAQKFIAERGVNNLYVGTKHEDKNHIHLHIAISGTQLNGRSSRISKQQLHHIKLELDRYQREKYPELSHSLPQHGRAKNAKTKEKIREAVKQSRQTQKALLCKHLEEAYKDAKSIDQFLSALKSEGYEPYYRDNGKLQGVIHEGSKYRFSRLGYDELSLRTLERVQEEKELASLQSLRSGSSRERHIDTRMANDRDKSEGLDKEEQESLDELSSLRSDGPDRGRGREDEDERARDNEADTENDSDEENDSR
jgi:hypothetical protein